MPFQLDWSLNVGQVGSVFLAGSGLFIGIGKMFWSAHNENQTRLHNISLEQLHVKQELLEKQNEAMNTLGQRQGESRELLVAHVSEDEAKFNSIDHRLERMDGKLDRLIERRA